jgi:two-component system, OmpR family, phosphate regulon sensor histidine kinase PhoR
MLLLELLGVLIAIILIAWIAVQSLRAVHLLHWLRAGAEGDSPVLHGCWSEIADRTRRLLRAQQRQALESEQRLQDFLAALQVSPNGVVLLDSDTGMEWFNHTAARHFGFDAQRDTSQYIGNLVRDPLFTAYLAERNFQHELVLQGRDHTDAHPIKLALQLHPYGKGRMLLLSRDITALEQADAMRRDFVANVSHEIRTPLTVFAGFVETLQTLQLEEEERQNYLELMGNQARRMQNLVDDLLTLSRLEGNAPPPLQDWVSMDVMLSQCEQEARQLAQHLGSKSTNIIFERPPYCELAGVLSELHSAFSNLISNALRYTPAGRGIRVYLQVSNDGSVMFAVQDQGVGIAPEHIARLTERFYRVDRSRSRDTGGTGLGLAIVKHVAQRHDATLSITSTQGKGSTFSIRFPAHRVRFLLQK